MTNLTITNARIVARDEIFSGDLIARDHDIVDVHAATSPSVVPGALDFEGDYLVPGFVEVNTRNLESVAAPRPGAHWPLRVAVVAHDAQMAASGVTTVFDAVLLGEFGLGDRLDRLEASVQAIEAAQMSTALRCRHRLHLCCELSFPGLQAMMSQFAFHPLLGLVSAVDRSAYSLFSFSDQFESFHEVVARDRAANVMAAAEGIASARARREARMECGPSNRDAVISLASLRGLRFGIRDAASAQEIEDARIAGAVIADCPATLEAAKAAREAGMDIVARAPDVVCDETRSNRVSALQLAREGLLDVLSSDYAPTSLLHAAFGLARQLRGGLSAAIRLATANAAEIVGLADCGEIALGKRADFVRVAVIDDAPVVRATWREGRRVA
jgi:alpha-D-ribose 1-methylphosphonate 5-triphosphate diphosphatase